jgi:hypothetical protein
MLLQEHWKTQRASSIPNILARLIRRSNVCKHAERFRSRIAAQRVLREKSLSIPPVASDVLAAKSRRDHLSVRLLEHYSHIRVAAKRDAVEKLCSTDLSLPVVPDLTGVLQNRRRVSFGVRIQGRHLESPGPEEAASVAGPHSR